MNSCDWCLTVRQWANSPVPMWLECATYVFVGCALVFLVGFGIGALLKTVFR